jgi:polysaccharide export outer membrane protein
MHNFPAITKYFLWSIFLISSLTSCLNTRKVAYFADVKDSALISSKSGLEPVIQKKDILSISVSSLSMEATVIFNTPNMPLTPNAAATNMPQTYGYLVGPDGNIKFPVLGDIPAAGLTQKQLEDNLTKMLTDKKLLFDPIVTSRFLNFRVTVLGEVNHPGVVNVPSEQISVLEAIGQAGDLTIYGLRDNVILIRQEGPEKKLVKRLNLTSSQLLKSPYFFLKSNDVLYVEPGKAKIAISDRTQQLLPIIFSGISVVVIILTSLLK